MEQLDLLLRDAKTNEASLTLIMAQKTHTDALKLCKLLSGLDDKQIAAHLGIDQAHWSRIWSGQAHFPADKYIEYMSICNNIIPLIWLAHSTGYTLKPLMTELEQQVVSQQKRINELELILQWEKDKGRAA